MHTDRPSPTSALALTVSLLASPAAWAQPAAAPDAPAQPAATTPDLTDPTAPPPVAADDDDDVHPLLRPLDRGWTFRVEPSYWYVAPRGDIVLPGSIAPLEFDGRMFEAGDETDLNTLNADDPTGGFLGRAHLAHNRWRFTFGAAALSTDGDTTADAPGRVGDAFFAEGDDITTEFDFASYEASASYILFHGPKAGEPGDPTRFRYTFEMLLGARVEDIDVDLDVTSNGGPRPPELGLSAGSSDIFAQPIGGVRLSMDLFDDFSIEVGVTVGYWSISGLTSSTWDVLAVFSWRPVANVGVQVGYRNLGLSATDEEDGEDFEFRGSAAGLFAGLVVQF